MLLSPKRTVFQKLRKENDLNCLIQCKKYFLSKSPWKSFVTAAHSQKLFPWCQINPNSDQALNNIVSILCSVMMSYLKNVELKLPVYSNYSINSSAAMLLAKRFFNMFSRLIEKTFLKDSQLY